MEIKRFIKKYIAIFIIAIIAITVISIIIKYQVEGESNLPFDVSKIMVISTASGNQKEDTDNKWDLELLQNNDIYIDIIKNKNYTEEEIIDKVIIDNFKIETEPLKGNVNIYKPATESGINNNTEENKIDGQLIFTGSESTNIENLEIANQGGLVFFRCSNENLGDYISNDDEEIRHDGTLIGKIGLTNDEITYTLSFDISIELKSGKKYTTSVTINMPTGNLIEEGTTNYQINKEQIIFKRY